MPSSRAIIRSTLATILQNGVPSAQAVYAYQPSDFRGQSPVLTLGSAGTQRERATMRGTRGTHYIELFWFVRVGSDVDGSTYTQSDAETLLDQVELEIATVVETNPGNALAGWISMRYHARSETTFLMVDRLEYKRESVILAIEASS